MKRHIIIGLGFSLVVLGGIVVIVLGKVSPPQTEDVGAIWQRHQPFYHVVSAGKQHLYTVDVDSIGVLCFDLWVVRTEPKLRQIQAEGKTYTVPSDTLQIVPVKHLHSWTVDPQKYAK